MRQARVIVACIMVLTVIFLISEPAVRSDNSLSFTKAYSQNADKPPNILLITGDDVGFADIGAYGSEIHTPNLDALAKEGKMLTNYHTHPLCSPARATLATGVDNHIVGIGTMYEDLAPNQVNKTGYETYITNRVVTVAELLRDAGYHTIFSGKWHLSGKTNESGTLPSDRGFEESFAILGGRSHHFTAEEIVPGSPVVYEHNGKIVPRPDNTTYSTDLYANILLESITKFEGDEKPLLMFYWPQAVLTPFQAPDEFLKKYEGVYDIGYDKIRENRFEKQKELGIWPADMPLPTRLPTQKSWDSLNDTEKEYRSKVMQAHAAQIDNFDYNIGRVLQHLKSIGEYDNTLIIFTSDNGSNEPVELQNLVFAGISPEETREHLSKFNNSIANIGRINSAVNFGTWGQAQEVTPFSYWKTMEGEGGTRPPFLIRPPVGEQQDSSVQNMIKTFAHVQDVVPTLLDYAGGIKHPSDYKGEPVASLLGKSMRPLLEGKVQQLYGENETVSQEIFDSSAVWMGDWKALKINPPVSTGQWQLFNITRDPGENNDISDTYPDVLQKMRSAYDKFASDVGIIVPDFEKGGGHAIGSVGKED